MFPSAPTKQLQRLLPAGAVAIAAALAACRTTRETDVFAAIDSNGDGRLALVEVENYGFRRMFNRFDKNKDKVINSADLEGSAPNLMRQRDMNGDGQITYAEYVAAGRRQGTVKKLFLAADTDRNGSISRREEQAYLSGGGNALLSD